jgi:cystathionine gamma-synthase
MQSNYMGKSKHIQTKAIHAGNNNAHQDLVPPIHLSTTFERNGDGTLGPFVYNRLDNPNRQALEKKIAALENAEHALVYASGLAAVNALFQHVLEPNAHILIPTDCYHGTKQLLQSQFLKWKIEFTMIDFSEYDNIVSAIKSNTKIIWIETPSNPQLQITDIKRVVELAKSKNITVICDNTFATCILQKPLEMGVDFVMQSSTKYLGGHSDILGGVISTNKTGIEVDALIQNQGIAGAVPSPFDCWLLNRSLATFPLRFSTQCSNAEKIAAYLNTHPKIEKVFYPGLSTHKNHALAAQQMQKGFGAMLSIIVKGNQAQTMQLANSLQLFKHATSLGGVESLVEHRRSVEGNNIQSPENLLRVSVGIEYVDDLIADLDQALAQL